MTFVESVWHCKQNVHNFLSHCQRDICRARVWSDASILWLSRELLQWRMKHLKKWFP
uniref:Uncharacterized protein n=1 Tax=Anguilla anguilla TaxID=7936 RepID=A0A0E9T800_ANGAN